jgi:hypothetical protein
VHLLLGVFVGFGDLDHPGFLVEHLLA